MGNDILDLEVNVLGRLTVRYMHDGAPPHYTAAVRNCHNENYADRRIDRGIDTSQAWPPRKVD